MTQSDIDRAIAHTEMQLKAYRNAEKMYDSAKHSTGIQETILKALEAYKPSEGCEVCANRGWHALITAYLPKRLNNFCPNCGAKIGEKE